MVIHNRGWGPQIEDALFVDQMTGHYRYSGERVPEGAVGGLSSGRITRNSAASETTGPMPVSLSSNSGTSPQKSGASGAYSTIPRSGGF
jgi:hypothetical protein